MKAVASDTTSTWETIIVLHFGTKAMKHFRSIVSNICAVESGLKPSYLWDEFVSPVETIREFVSDIKAASILRADLHVLLVGEDVFVLSLSHTEDCLTIKRDSYFPLIDVSKSLKSPKCAATETVKLMQKHLALVVKQLQIPANSALENGNNHTEIMQLELESSCNVSSLFGALLNYPVIYWYDSSLETGNDSCLAMNPLRVFSVTAKPLFPIASSLERKTASAHTIYSFSVPEYLAEDFKTVVQTWFADLQTSFQSQQAFTDLCLEVRTATLSSVAL